VLIEREDLSVLMAAVAEGDRLAFKHLYDRTSARLLGIVRRIVRDRPLAEDSAVTGTAAIVASVTGLRGAALRTRILSTTDDLGAAGYDTNFGNGRLNAYRAVTGGSLAAGQ